jgi:Ran GTPase-activating protein (RanGAP) involved in mRNA processing and transport
LKLGNNKLKDKSCEHIYEGLKDNHQLTHLHLEGNQFGTEGARFIAILLLSKKTELTHLYLDNNLIEDEGAEFLATSLK